jgi:hypothetical protein
MSKKATFATIIFFPHNPSVKQITKVSGKQQVIFIADVAVLSP